MIRILKKDLAIDRIRRSGPGGQNRNRRATGIRVRHMPSGFVATAWEKRSQAANLKTAIERLRFKLIQASIKKKKRKKTKKPKRAVESRLQQKKKRSDLKKQRRSVDY